MRCCSQPWRVPSRSIGLSAGRRRLSCSDGEAALVRQQVTWVIGKPHVQTDASDPARQRLMSWLPGDLPCLPVHRVNTLDTVAVNFPQGKLSQAKPLHLRWFAFDRRSHIPVRHEIRDVLGEGSISCNPPKDQGNLEGMTAPVHLAVRKLRKTKGVQGYVMSVSLTASDIVEWVVMVASPV